MYIYVYIYTHIHVFFTGAEKWYVSWFMLKPMFDGWDTFFVARLPHIYIYIHITYIYMYVCMYIYIYIHHWV